MLQDVDKCNAKLAMVTLQKELRQKSYIVLQHVKAIHNVTAEIVMGAASIEVFLQTTQDDGTVKENFAGFGWQHLNMSMPAVANLALPHLTDLLTLAIFHKQDVMLEMLAQLPPQNTYNVLALDALIEPAEPFANVPPSVRPLSDLLVEGPLKPTLTRLMRCFYYTKVSYEKVSELVDQEIVLICTTDKIVQGGGILSGGWTANAQNEMEKLSEAVSLQVDIFKLEHKLREHAETISDLERLMHEPWNSIDQFRADTFDRFDGLLHTFPEISDIPFLLEHLVRQQTILTRQQVRLELFGEFLKHLKTDQFQDRTFYEQRVHDGKNAIEQANREWYSYRQTLDKTFVDLKNDVRTLGEFLVTAQTLRMFSLPLNLHQLLVTKLTDFRNELENTFQQFIQEHAEQPSAFDTMDQLDLIQQESIEAECQMMLHSFLLREMSTFYQEFRLQYPTKKSPKKTNVNLQYVYEARRKLNNTQPAYSAAQIERFKLKLDLCRNNLQMLTAYRTPVVSNMTLPCINKLAAIKFRLIAQMMANIPTHLNQPGSIRLNFQYDQTKYSDNDSKKVGFRLEHIIGLAVEFVDEEQNLIRSRSGESATLAHLILFTCFLSVEGCKLLVLDKCFTDLSQEEHENVRTLLQAISQNMQIFLITELDE